MYFIQMIDEISNQLIIKCTSHIDKVLKTRKMAGIQLTSISKKLEERFGSYWPDFNQPEKLMSGFSKFGTCKILSFFASSVCKYFST